MPAPGITVNNISSAPPSVGSAPEGTWFVTGIASQGAVGVPISIRSLSEFVAKCGPRNAASPLYDSAELFFRSGGSQLYVSRIVGTGQATAQLVLMDTKAVTPTSTLTVKANSSGAWGIGITVAVTSSGAGFYQIHVNYGGVTDVEVSPVLSTPTDAVNWSSVSNYITIVDMGSTATVPTNNPAVISATALAGGVDDNATIVEGGWTTALTVFSKDLGPGQVSAPGRTTDPAHVALLNHASVNNRIAYCDGVDTATAATNVTAAATSLVGGQDGSYGCILAPWVIIPGIPTNTAIPAAPRTVPPSALAAAVTAKSDGSTYSQGFANTNIAPAGDNWYAPFVIGVTQVFSDADRAALNVVGVNVIRNINAKVQLYGFRSLSPDPTWTELNWSRLRMSLVVKANVIAANIGEFAAIDAKGQVFGRLAGALGGMLSSYWSIGALYGVNAGDAYKIDVGPSVNTATTIAAGQNNALISIKRAPFAEFTNVTIINVPLTQPL